MVDFDANEWAMISIMRRYPNRWFTTNELAEGADIAWETAERALKSLHRMGYVVRGRKRSRFYWRLY